MSSTAMEELREALASSSGAPGGGAGGAEGVGGDGEGGCWSDLGGERGGGNGLRESWGDIEGGAGSELRCCGAGGGIRVWLSEAMASVVGRRCRRSDLKKRRVWWLSAEEGTPTGKRGRKLAVRGAGGAEGRRRLDLVQARSGENSGDQGLGGLARGTAGLRDWRSSSSRTVLQAFRSATRGGVR